MHRVEAEPGERIGKEPAAGVGIHNDRCHGRAVPAGFPLIPARLLCSIIVG